MSSLGFYHQVNIPLNRKFSEIPEACKSVAPIDQRSKQLLALSRVQEPIPAWERQTM